MLCVYAYIPVSLVFNLSTLIISFNETCLILETYNCNHQLQVVGGALAVLNVCFCVFHTISVIALNALSGHPF
jgi:hypothetical protein